MCGCGSPDAATVLHRQHRTGSSFEMLRDGAVQLQETSVTRTASTETEDETPATATDLTDPPKYRTVHGHRSGDLADADLPRLPPSLMTPLNS